MPAVGEVKCLGLPRVWHPPTSGEAWLSRSWPSVSPLALNLEGVEALGAHCDGLRAAAGSCPRHGSRLLTQPHCLRRPLPAPRLLHLFPAPGAHHAACTACTACTLGLQRGQPSLQCLPGLVARKQPAVAFCPGDSPWWHFLLFLGGDAAGRTVPSVRARRSRGVCCAGRAGGECCRGVPARILLSPSLRCRAAGTVPWP